MSRQKCQLFYSKQQEIPGTLARRPMVWARTQGYCKRGSAGQRKTEKIRATFWDSESISTGVWCVAGFGAGLEIALGPLKSSERRRNPGKRALSLSAPNSAMHQRLI